MCPQIFRVCLNFVCQAFNSKSLFFQNSRFGGAALTAFLLFRKLPSSILRTFPSSADCSIQSPECTNVLQYKSRICNTYGNPLR